MEPNVSLLIVANAMPVEVEEGEEELEGIETDEDEELDNDDDDEKDADDDL